MSESAGSVAGPKKRGRSRLQRFLRVAIPIVVSGLLFVYLFSRIDVRAVAESISAPIVLRWLFPLLLFNVVTVAIEAHCLHRVAGAAGVPLDRWTAARIKSACYLLGILNYALGAAGLSVLLRRRARIPLADSASMVVLISLFDIGAVLLLAAAGAVFLDTGLESNALGIRFGLIGAMILAIVGGFVFLRAPVGLGPLERLRRLDVFKAPRTAPLTLLLELATLRIVFVGCFVGLMASLFWAFEIEVGLIRVGLNTAIMLVVSALPIAAGGLGTGQLVFVELFRDSAPAAELLAASLVSSFGLITTRALLGLSFAFEFTREAIDATRDELDR